jgi:glycosyltransferase involved in cell wall biosynthesis
MQRFRAAVGDLDAMLIQGPSPLLPHLVKASGHLPVGLIVWGDYGAWQPRPTFPKWRNAAIWVWIKIYGVQQRRASKGLVAFVQNPLLASTVAGADVTVVPFSSLSEASLAGVGSTESEWAAEKGHTIPVRLLYSGRIVREKGLFEAVDAVKILRDRGYLVSFDLLGWEDPRDPTIDALEKHAGEVGVSERVRFLGYLPAGPDLLQIYADADIFVIPTYWDSLPRSMQEAMAVGLPVVATSVGGIAYHLRNREHAMLVSSRRPDELADAVAELVDNAQLRRTIAENGRTWARGNTLESNVQAVLAVLGPRADVTRSAP